MPFDAAPYQDMHDRFAAKLAKPIVIMLNTGAAFTQITGARAFISHYKENDLLPGTSVQLGDLRLIINIADIPAAVNRPLETKDRIQIDGRNYGVIHWDEYTRTVGQTRIAVEVAVRG